MQTRRLPGANAPHESGRFCCHLYPIPSNHFLRDRFQASMNWKCFTELEIFLKINIANFLNVERSDFHETTKRYWVLTQPHWSGGREQTGTPLTPAATPSPPVHYPHYSTLQFSTLLSSGHCKKPINSAISYQGGYLPLHLYLGSSLENPDLLSLEVAYIF